MPATLTSICQRSGPSVESSSVSVMMRSSPAMVVKIDT